MAAIKHTVHTRDNLDLTKLTEREIFDHIRRGLLSYAEFVAWAAIQTSSSYRSGLTQAKVKADG